MLVVHPSSQCDVCLDAYTWSTPTKAPHAIQCGHIFCREYVSFTRIRIVDTPHAELLHQINRLYSCLRTVNPSNCPLCRKAFNPDRIKKLHVDKAPAENGALTGKMKEENELLRRVGMLFAEDAEDADINELVEEVTVWLGNNAGSSVSRTILIFRRFVLARSESRVLTSRALSAPLALASTPPQRHHRSAPVQGAAVPKGHRLAYH